MLEKQNNCQLELFSGGKDSLGIKARKPGTSFFTYFRNHEKAILTIISVIITGVISFSLGVEKGRRLSLSNSSSRFDVALKKATPQQDEGIAARQTEKQNITEEPKVRELIEVYTIQLASYKTKTYAQREAEALKKNGLSPLVLSKGSYAVLCVGNFSSREEARSSLSQFKRKYQGCYIRRL
jgi:hypothetical protein